jgi:hypothetical protein
VEAVAAVPVVVAAVVVAAAVPVVQVELVEQGAPVVLPQSQRYRTKSLYSIPTTSFWIIVGHRTLRLRVPDRLWASSQLEATSQHQSSSNFRSRIWSAAIFRTSTMRIPSFLSNKSLLEFLYVSKDNCHQKYKKKYNNNKYKVYMPSPTNKKARKTSNKPQQTSNKKQQQQKAGSPASRDVMSTTIRHGRQAGGAAPVVGRGEILKAPDVELPIDNSRLVWNTVAPYQTRIASQDFQTMGAIDRGLVYPNQPHESQALIFGGSSSSSSAKKKTKSPSTKSKSKSKSKPQSKSKPKSKC